MKIYSTQDYSTHIHIYYTINLLPFVNVIFNGYNDFYRGGIKFILFIFLILNINKNTINHILRIQYHGKKKPL